MCRVTTLTLVILNSSFVSTQSPIWPPLAKLNLQVQVPGQIKLLPLLAFPIIDRLEASGQSTEGEMKMIHVQFFACWSALIKT